MDKVIELFKTPGFTAVLASLGAVLITGLFNMQIDKRRERQQFIRQILPKRMKAYSAILIELATSLEKITYLLRQSPKDRIKEIPQFSKRFHTVYLQNMLWLESNVSNLCGEIEALFVRTSLTNDKKNTKEELTYEEHLVFLTEFAGYFGWIQKHVKTGIGIKLLDKILSEMAVKPKKRSRKPSE